MCLVNELARYNKIQHQYRLTGEQGPAHKKIFTVTLKLGDEEYEAEGPSIKKAQHSAAAQALSKTQLKHPPPKTTKNIRPGMRNRSTGMVTPTVELNALAMKRGERTVYIVENGGPTHHLQVTLILDTSNVLLMYSFRDTCPKLDTYPGIICTTHNPNHVTITTHGAIMQLGDIINMIIAIMVSIKQDFITTENCVLFAYV